MDPVAAAIYAELEGIMEQQPAGEVLPCEGCGGKCCKAAPFLRSEWRRVRRKHGVPSGARVVDRVALGREGYLVVKKSDGITCGYLRSGKCSIYEDRPVVCRAYGQVPEMPCQVLHPGTGLIAADRLLQRVFAAGVKAAAKGPR